MIYSALILIYSAGAGSAAGLQRDVPVSLGFLRQGRSAIQVSGHVSPLLVSSPAAVIRQYSGTLMLFRSPADPVLATAEAASSASVGNGGGEVGVAGNCGEVLLLSQSRGVLEHLNDIIVDYFAALPSRVSRASFRSSCALSRHSMEKVVAEGDAVHSTMTASGPSLGPGRTRLVRSVSEDVLGTDLGSKRVHKDSACELLDQGMVVAKGEAALHSTMTASEPSLGHGGRRLVRSVSEDVLGTDLGSKRVHKDSACEILDQAKQQGDEILLKLSQVRRQVWRRRLVLLFGSALHKFVPDRSKRKSDRIHMTKDIV